MKVYFSGALYTQGNLLPNYKKIVKCLTNNGYEVMEDTSVTPFTKFQKMNEEEIKNNYNNVKKWIEKCDFAVFEASFPSTLSIGHEISLALSKGKPVIVMYLKDRSPRFLMGNNDDNIVWACYGENVKEKSIDEVLANAFEKVKNKINIRFNLFVPRTLMAYLDWVTKDVGVNKSEYIRVLIEKEVKKKK